MSLLTLPSTLDMEPSTLDCRQKDRLLGYEHCYYIELLYTRLTTFVMTSKDLSLNQLSYSITGSTPVFVEIWIIRDRLNSVIKNTKIDH